jgi:hypothetical protein
MSNEGFQVFVMAVQFVIGVVAGFMLRGVLDNRGRSQR